MQKVLEMFFSDERLQILPIVSPPVRNEWNKLVINIHDTVITKLIIMQVLMMNAHSSVFNVFKDIQQSRII